jgi:tetratricopeptide (TPR) repeat protein
MSSTAPKLSTPSTDEAAEDAILDYIFNPGLSGVPTQNAIVKAPTGSTYGLDEVKWAALQELQLQAIRAAENKQYEEALQFLTTAEEACAVYAGTFNNRAQLRTLQYDVSLPEHAAVQKQVMADLNKAVELATAVKDQQLLQDIHTQRGALYKLLKDDENALKDFEIAGKLGSRFARQQAVELNPYAAMCNKMLTNAIQEMQLNPSKPSPQTLPDTAIDLNTFDVDSLFLPPASN